MKTITKLAMQNSNKNRVNLYLDNKFFCGLDLETTIKYGLKVGTIITEEKITEIQSQSEKQKAYTQALKLINTRYKTQKEVEKYLYEKGYLAPVVYYVIDKLNEYHYIDDERYVQSYISSHKSTFGKLKIKQQLLLKGVSEQIVDNALDEENFEQNEEILHLAEKYMRNKENTKDNYIKLLSCLSKLWKLI